MVAKTSRRPPAPRPPRAPYERATIIQEIASVKGTMNHSYRDYSKVAPSSLMEYPLPTDIDSMSFAQKVHHMLSGQNKEYEQWISWMPHGRAFKVHRPAEFEREICPVYFGHQRYSSFLRSLNNYGFKHISKGPDRNCKYHRSCNRAITRIHENLSSHLNNPSFFFLLFGNHRLLSRIHVARSLPFDPLYAPMPWCTSFDGRSCQRTRLLLH